MRSKKSKHQKTTKYSPAITNKNLLISPVITHVKGRVSNFNENITKISEIVSSMEDSSHSKISFNIRSILK